MNNLTRRLAGLGITAAAATALLTAPTAQAAAPSGEARAAAAPAAVSGCTPLGGGKYNCYVWTDAPSYYEGNVATGGVLHQGWNYFYCQAQGSEYSANGYQNFWWGKTDDDNGHHGVWVNVVYLSGGANDQAEPGLPGC